METDLPKQLQEIKDRSYDYKQRTEGWYKMRNEHLTASTIIKAIGLGSARDRENMLVEKASLGKYCTFFGNEATRWGTRYEQVANDIFIARNNNINVYEFGLVTNKKYPILAVSPDGILENGEMLEIKCPFSRKIDGNIKKEYYHQMQAQMSICELDKCHFLECKLVEFYNSVKHKDNSNTKELEIYADKTEREKGILIELIGEDGSDYKYSPIVKKMNDENVKMLKKWQRKTLKKNKRPREEDNNYPTKKLDDNVRIYHWVIDKYNCQMLEKDPRWIEMYYPKIEECWDEIQELRKEVEEKGLEAILKERGLFKEEVEDIYVPPISKGVCLL